jgi:hypothetical protein
VTTRGLDSNVLQRSSAILSTMICRLIVLLSAATTPVSAQIAEWLNRPLLDPLQPMVEMQIYTGSHVPQMPIYSSAEEWNRYAAALRTRILDEVVFRGTAKHWRNARTQVEWLGDLQGDGYVVRKLRYEALPGMWIPALLYQPKELHGKTAAVLNLNGHEALGMAEPRWQINCINQAKRGLISLKPDWPGTGELKANAHVQMNQIDLTGASGVSVFYLAMSRALDILANHPNVDTARLAVTGLSGGGWQTILISALDTRVALTDPVAGYSSLITKSQFPTTDLGDSEQVMTGLGTMADYTHLTALLAPRWALISNNAKDTCCFRADFAPAPLLAAASPVYKLLGKPDRFSHFVSYDPAHNYAQMNREAFYALLQRGFFANDSGFQVREIQVDAELRSPEQLAVPLPPENLRMTDVARSLIANLPQRIADPKKARKTLAEVVRAHEFKTQWNETAHNSDGDRDVSFYQVKMDADWTVPTVVVKPARGSKETVLLLSDEGRSSLAVAAAQAARSGATVVAFDPLGIGENHIASRYYLWALLLSCLGERTVGIQASQILAIARDGTQRFPGTVTVKGYGHRSSLAVLIAAALRPDLINGIELHDQIASLKELILKNTGVDQEPDMFCFGLLEHFDLPELRDLAHIRQ